MDLVTISDLDSIEGCLRLIDERGDPPDFLIGEEIEARLPGSPLRVHLTVWGISPAQHKEIHRLTASVEEVAAFLRAEQIASCFSHFVGSLPVDLPSAATYWRILSLFDALEVRNGGQGRQYNALTAELAVGEAERRGPVAFVGGSDAHTLRRVGTTWTEAAARSREEFLEAIRRGETEAGGRIRNRPDIVKDITELTLSHYAAVREGLRGGGGRWAKAPMLQAAAGVPLQVLGAPLIGTAIYFWRVRSQVRALRREIASLDLRDFRERMSAFPRGAGLAPPPSSGRSA